MGKFGLKEITPISDVQAAIGAGAMLSFFVLWGLIAAVGDDFLSWIGGKNNLSGWVQAVGSIAAIIAAALGIKWQIDKGKALQEQAEIRNNIQMSEVCLEMCNAIFSIMNEKDSARKKRLPFDFFKGRSEAWDAHVARSIERVFDLQEVMRNLVGKNMPAELLKSLFGLQKTLAQYKVLLMYMDGLQSNSGTLDFWGSITAMNSPEALVKIKNREIRNDVNKMIRKIVDFKESLEKLQK